MQTILKTQFFSNIWFSLFQNNQQEVVWICNNMKHRIGLSTKGKFTDLTQGEIFIQAVNFHFINCV